MTAANRVRELSRLLEGTGIGLLELTTPGDVFRLRRDGVAIPNAAEPLQQPVTIRAPAPGVFRTAHPLQEERLAAPGHPVVAGEAVALLQVGALLLHVVAPADGVVVEVLSADGDLVGYGAELLRMTEGQR